MCRLNRLRRQRLGPVHHSGHHKAGRVYIRRPLEWLILLLRWSFACELLSTGLRVICCLRIVHFLVDVATWLPVRQRSCHLSNREAQAAQRRDVPPDHTAYMDGQVPPTKARNGK